jgi:hypothetical protein
VEYRASFVYSMDEIRSGVSMSAWHWKDRATLIDHWLANGKSVVLKRDLCEHVHIDTLIVRSDASKIGREHYAAGDHA